MMKRGWFWVVVGLAVLGCRTTSPTAHEQSSVLNLVPFQVLDAWVEGDSLRSVVQHSGGCDIHTFSLHTTSPLLKSLPPKQPVAWEHRSSDPCRAMVVDTISTSVVHLRGTPRGVTILLLDQWEPELFYTYP